MNFSGILFLLLTRSNSKSPRPFRFFGRTLGRNFIWIRQQVKFFPIDPHCKNPSTFNFKEHRMTLQWGSMGKFFICCLIRLKFRLRVRLKRSYDRGEFEFDWARSKNNIAENSFALAFETHSTISLQRCHSAWNYYYLAKGNGLGWAMVWMFDLTYLYTTDSMFEDFF